MKTFLPKALGWGAHLYTALGVVCSVLIFHAIVDERYADALWWILVSTFIDFTDGTLARAAKVTVHVPNIDGKHMDHLVDFLNVTFLPLVMISRAGWVPEPGWLWVGIASVASLFNYSMIKTNAHRDGFLQGFPAIYSIFVLYAFVFRDSLRPEFTAALLVTIAVLELLPLRFARARDAYMFRPFFVYAGLLWFAEMVAMILLYPAIPTWLTLASLVYPVGYVVLSIYADFRARKERSQPTAQAVA
jgi:phosphatidylcholine synthase